MQAQVKAFVVLFVALAILYILISPLPEMAATNSGKPYVILALFLSILLILVVEPFLVFLFSKQVERGPGLNRALLCSRLC